MADVVLERPRSTLESVVGDTRINFAANDKENPDHSRNSRTRLPKGTGMREAIVIVVQSVSAFPNSWSSAHALHNATRRRLCVRDLCKAVAHIPRRCIRGGP
jgi:hypothetical protein